MKTIDVLLGECKKLTFVAFPKRQDAWVRLGNKLTLPLRSVSVNDSGRPFEMEVQCPCCGKYREVGIHPDVKIELEEQ